MSENSSSVAKPVESMVVDSAAPPSPERPVKRQRVEQPQDVASSTAPNLTQDGVRDGKARGMAPIKAEFIIPRGDQPLQQQLSHGVEDDDAAEGRGNEAMEDGPNGSRGGRSHNSNNKRDGKKKEKGQNTQRRFGKFEEKMRLCNCYANHPEFSPRPCNFGDSCKLSHDLRKYLEEGNPADLTTFGAVCPVFEALGKCPSGWKCRFVRSHMDEIDREDGRKELVLVTKQIPSDAADSSEKANTANGADADEGRPGIVNNVGTKEKIDLSRKRVDFSKADQYIDWINKDIRKSGASNNSFAKTSEQNVQDSRANFVDPPFLASEKRRLYFGPETPLLAPLTTQGNIPFRRLCVELGAQLTYSEMAMGLPLLQGTKTDWTLLRAHKSEIEPPKFTPSGTNFVIDGYDNSRDLRFGAQISASVPWQAIKAADVLNRYCPHLRLIDLNCGCPIDMIFKAGAGSALLEGGNKLERMIRGMNAVSGEVPVTAKIRTGIRNNKPTASTILSKLAFGSREHRERLGGPGCAAVTLHGRSREQRYTKSADWGFIAECATLVKNYNQELDSITDTIAEPDARTLSASGKMYFIGNGDCYSHHDYFSHIQDSGVHSVMVGRGALVKPWIFEEIEKGQYLDKSSSERLGYVERFVKYGLEAWGSDELGINYTRRFLLEWLSFTHRYVPIGLLEYLPPSLNDRPPPYRGRDEMETLLASDNYKDWIKISEMYLGPASDGFQFIPKHKSNAYEAEG